MRICLNRESDFGEISTLYGEISNRKIKFRAALDGYSVQQKCFRRLDGYKDHLFFLTFGIALRFLLCYHHNDAISHFDTTDRRILFVRLSVLTHDDDILFVYESWYFFLLKVRSTVLSVANISNAPLKHTSLSFRCSSTCFMVFS